MWVSLQMIGGEVGSDHHFSDRDKDPIFVPQVLRYTLKLAVNDKSLGVRVPEYGWNLNLEAHTDEDLARVNAMGLLCLLYIYHTGEAPIPVPPLLLLLCLHEDHSLIYDQLLFEEVEPKLANQLSPLGHRYSPKFRSGKLASLLAASGYSVRRTFPTSSPY